MHTKKKKRCNQAGPCTSAHDSDLTFDSVGNQVTILSKDDCGNMLNASGFLGEVNLQVTHTPKDYEGGFKNSTPNLVSNIFTLSFNNWNPLKTVGAHPTKLVHLKAPSRHTRSRLEEDAPGRPALQDLLPNSGVAHDQRHRPAGQISPQRRHPLPGAELRVPPQPRMARRAPRSRRLPLETVPWV